MENKKLFSEYMAGLSELFDKSLSDVLAEMYWISLRPHTDGECKAAFDLAIVKCRFFPKPAELIEFIAAQHEPQISIEAVAEQQWRLVLSSLGSGDFDDPVTAHLCKRQFAYRYLQNLLETNEHWEQKRFCEAYRLASEYHPGDLQIEQVDPQVRLLVETIAERSQYINPREERIAKLRKQADTITGSDQ
jgi:hypothetical protein